MSYNNRTARVLLLGGGVLCLLVLVAAVSVVSAGDGLHRIDDDHGLTSEDAIEEFEEDGVASTEVETPHVGLTVAEEAEDCDIDASVPSDIRNDYLCIDHHAEQQQTLRIYIPNDYWHPYVREELQPVDDGPEASLQPTENGSYTSVSVTISGNQSVVYPISEDVAASYSVISKINERTESFFGVTISSPGTQWTSINESEWGDRPSIAIRAPPDRLQVEYDAGDAENGSDREWLSVPDSKLKPAPVYQMEREGANQTVYVVAEDDDPPRLRYRVRGSGLLSVTDAIHRDIEQIDDKVRNMADSVVPDWVS